MLEAELASTSIFYKEYKCSIVQADYDPVY